MDLVDEQNDVARLLNFFDAFLQAVLEFAAILGTGDQRRDVKRDQTLVAQDVGNLVGNDELSQALDDSGFANARLADEKRVVLLAARKDLHDALDLAGAADNGVKSALACFLGKVGAEFLQHVAGGRGGCERAAAGVHRALADQIVQSSAHVIAGNAHTPQHIKRRAFALADDAQQQVLGGDVALTHLHGLAHSVLKNALHARRERQMARNVGVGIDDDSLTDCLHGVVVLNIQTLKRLRGKAVLFLDKAEQDMLGSDIRLVELAGLFLSKDQNLASLVGEFLERHG